MADRLIMIDTSVLIDFYRKADKANTFWIALIREGYRFAVSVITKYEIYSGATMGQMVFWGDVFQNIETIPFDEISANAAVEINSELKRKRKQIDVADLFIAASAFANNLPIATLNKKHFDRIDNLELIG